MSLRMLKFLTIVLPPFIIGGFEYFRHDFMLGYLSMEAGNLYITVITLILSYFFASWMFRSIETNNMKLAEEKARRAVYEDRERLARELHDDLAQTLFFLNVKLKQGHLEEAKGAVLEIDNSLRQAIFNLRTPPEEGADFELRLHKWLGDWQKIAGIELIEHLDLAHYIFNPAEEVQLFGIVQEAFTNIRKHSKATHAEIRIHTEEGGWRMLISDNGCGLRHEAVQTKCYGMDMMRKRASEMGASFEIVSKPGDNGTQLWAEAKRGNG
ncbi:sensor histidine kinase [Paenibacillus sp. GP183]|uniref:sensor histidine kinase n=1 Tax=Paenibacillus sp. GP183 TaxID=1882751 RepID=UPI0008967F23|nr:sensor histidine kinase [Paenibacillus sp. GP183]SEC55504.1 two-component system, NarL family, nitrate/nitrite sensor histidine kinase NarX [Paenibacillus sp. GP183]